MTLRTLPTHPHFDFSVRTFRCTVISFEATVQVFACYKSPSRFIQIHPDYQMILLSLQVSQCAGSAVHGVSIAAWTEHYEACVVCIVVTFAVSQVPGEVLLIFTSAVSCPSFLRFFLPLQLCESR